MRETELQTLQTFEANALFTGRSFERNGVNLTSTFTTSAGEAIGTGSRNKKDLHNTRLTLCLLIGTNSDLHDVLGSN